MPLVAPLLLIPALRLWTPETPLQPLDLLRRVEKIAVLRALLEKFRAFILETSQIPELLAFKLARFRP